MIERVELRRPVELNFRFLQTSQRLEEVHCVTEMDFGDGRAKLQSPLHLTLGSCPIVVVVSQHAAQVSMRNRETSIQLQSFFQSAFRVRQNNARSSSPPHGFDEQQVSHPSVCERVLGVACERPLEVVPGDPNALRVEPGREMPSPQVEI